MVWPANARTRRGHSSLWLDLLNIPVASCAGSPQPVCWRARPSPRIGDARKSSRRSIPTWCRYGGFALGRTWLGAERVPAPLCMDLALALVVTDHGHGSVALTVARHVDPDLRRHPADQSRRSSGAPIMVLEDVRADPAAIAPIAYPHPGEFAPDVDRATAKGGSGLLTAYELRNFARAVRGEPCAMRSAGSRQIEASSGRRGPADAAGSGAARCSILRPCAALARSAACAAFSSEILASGHSTTARLSKALCERRAPSRAAVRKICRRRRAVVVAHVPPLLRSKNVAHH